MSILLPFAHLLVSGSSSLLFPAFLALFLLNSPRSDLPPPSPPLPACSTELLPPSRYSSSYCFHLPAMSQSRPGLFPSLRMGGKVAPFPAAIALLTISHRGHPRKGPRWPDGRGQGDLLHSVQDRGQWFVRRRVPDQDGPQR